MLCYKIFNLIHGVTAVLCLTIAVAAIVAPKRPGRHTELGEAYHIAYLTMSISTVVMAVMQWSTLWHLVPVSMGSYALALSGYLIGKHKRGNWLPLHLATQVGSIIALCTALAVEHSNYMWTWFVPALVGAISVKLAFRSLGLRLGPSG